LNSTLRSWRQSIHHVVTGATDGLLTAKAPYKPDPKVERTFSWFGRNRRLSKHFENLAETLASFVTLASIELAVRRLARA
jgi:hypothetical protein